jgi:oligopeptide/dipeptide ABC transporter ATP-binding protein
MSHELRTPLTIVIGYSGLLKDREGLGPTERLFADRIATSSQALLSVIPVPNPRKRRERIILQGQPPNPVQVPTGCRFHPRCPKVMDRCRVEDPTLAAVGAGSHQAACWLVSGGGTHV